MVNKSFFKFIIVVLVYKNYSDLESLIPNLISAIPDSKIVIVNSFFSIKIKNKVKEISLRFNCDFLNVTNKGYGYGNNKGIKYSLENYNFNYLIISNPDVEISYFDNSINDLNAVYAPNIINLNGKSLNPMLVNKDKIAYFFEFIGYKYNLYPLIYFGVFFHKIQRITYNLFKLRFPIFAPHGSFIIMGRNVFQKITLFDENIFLYGEEVVLGYRLALSNLKVKYLATTSIIHKENGSLNLTNLNKYKLLKKANIYIYSNYISKQK